MLVVVGGAVRLDILAYASPSTPKPPIGVATGATPGRDCPLIVLNINIIAININGKTVLTLNFKKSNLGTFILENKQHFRLL